ncbi:MAG: hypothetical protein LIP77_05460 [Planctomycetes bacterium]|nr:hypothetical protein [Planctomycetota bacterium]
MTTTSGDPVDPALPVEPAIPSGKAAVLVPLIIGGAVIIAVIMLWESHYRKRQILAMVHIEDMVKENLRRAYRDLRLLDPERALFHARLAESNMQKLRSSLSTDYLELKVTLRLIQGEAVFTADCATHAAAAEAYFSEAIESMSHASGEMWEFGLYGRARARYELGKYAEADTDLTYLLDRNPSFGAAYYWRSLTREKLGRADAAADDARQAWNLDSWPPLRDFLQTTGTWDRDIFGRPKTDPSARSQRPRRGQPVRPSAAE